jgi:hypothetical protein
MATLDAKAIPAIVNLFHLR